MIFLAEVILKEFVFGVQLASRTEEISTMRRTHLAGSIVLGVFGGILIFVAGRALSAQRAGDASGNASRARLLEVMARQARSLKLTESDKPVLLGADPLFRYDDKARGIEDSTIWAWGVSGRPSAVLKLELNPARPTDRHWLYGIVSLSPNLIKVEGDVGWQWSATKPGLDLRDIAGAPMPAGTESLRLGQMKQLARRFEAFEFSGPHGRLQLRLLPRPIHRYADPPSGLVDGAIFAFAYGTNPDLLLVIESRQGQGDAAPKWQYGVARLGAGKLFLHIDRKEVWSQPGSGIPARKETYMNRFQRDQAER
jgi:hypothetical protein